MFTRPRLALIHDGLMAGVALLAAFYLRMGETMFALPADFLAETTLMFMLVALIAFALTGVPRTNWRFVSLADFVVIAKGATLAVLLFVPTVFLVTRLELVPRSAVVIGWLVLILLLALPRAAYRLLREGHFSLRQPTPADHIPVLLVGYGPATDLFLRATADRRRSDYVAVGIIDDKIARHGGRIHGVPILGGADALPEILDKLNNRGIRPRKLVIADPQMQAKQIGTWLERAEAHGLTLGRAPSPTLLDNPAGPKVPIEAILIEDLLGRAQTQLDPTGPTGALAGKRVLVTGAGGSIGAEIVRQIAACGPARLVLLDASEYNLYAIDLEMAERWPGLDRGAVLGDVRHRAQLERLFAAERPELVFHAAAFKHVPLIEENPVEGAWTNVLGTRHLADLCCAHGVEAMVMISTDKAVNPTNVMGATKRLAESYCQSLDLAGPTRFVTVRFGNVLGSTGSVVPLFKRQLAAGGPLTVTHPDITRYFMTIAEAVALVLQALSLRLAEPEEASGKIYVLDMGEPVKIIDVARQMIRLAGLVPERDIAIKITGLRPGEKMTEELFHAGEALANTRLQSVMLAAPRPLDTESLARAIDELAAGCANGDPAEVVACLRRYVPEFAPDL